PQVFRDPQQPLGLRGLEPVQAVRCELHEFFLAEGPPALEPEQERDGPPHVFRGTTSQKSTIAPRPPGSDAASRFGRSPPRTASPSGTSSRRDRGKSPFSSTTRAVSSPHSRHRRRRSPGGTSRMDSPAQSRPRT